MHTGDNRVAALANVLAYKTGTTINYIDGAPHIKHSSLRHLYSQLVVEVFDIAKTLGATPKVLDLGAGEGSVTLPFLELGANVVAVDISKSQLDVLKSKCKEYNKMLEVRCEDINDTLKNQSDKYDIIVFNSFLHHIPDYLSVIKEAVTKLKPCGQLFTFQDPLRYDTLNMKTLLFSKVAYLSWRVFKGDVIGGFSRWVRRRRGVYIESAIHDNVEYHVIRNGVDKDAICEYLEEIGLVSDVVLYFSTQSRIFQSVGASLGLKNSFAIKAQRTG